MSDYTANVPNTVTAAVIIVSEGLSHCHDTDSEGNSRLVVTGTEEQVQNFVDRLPEPDNETKVEKLS